MEREAEEAGLDCRGGLCACVCVCVFLPADGPQLGFSLAVFSSSPQPQIFGKITDFCFFVTNQEVKQNLQLRRFFFFFLWYL